MAGDVNSINSIADTASNGTPRYASEKVGGGIVASITIKDITNKCFSSRLLTIFI